ncbi:inositol monophosphatase family protein [soil metagenome]
MTNDQRPLLSTAIRAAQAAAKLQQFYAGGDLEITTKSGETDLVTKVDKLCEARIREILLSAYPDHVVLGEEEGQPDGASRYRWIVDPVDGTTNYAQGFPFYCVSIGLELDGVMEIGVVLDGVRGELFTAVKGGGAFLNGVPIEVTQKTELIDALVATGFAYHQDTIRENIEVFARVHERVRSVRRPGAAALDLSYVACGRLDGFWELGLKPWDAAAGILLIQEAGGTITGAAGEPYSLGDRVLVASNGHLHMKLVTLMGLGEVLA